VTDIIKESVWFVIICCFFTVGGAKFLQLSFVIFVGEELTEFGFVGRNVKKTLRTTDLNYLQYCRIGWVAINIR